MTLQEFLEVTEGIPDTVLRRAMVAALSIEPARTPAACRRFYDRVVRDLRPDVTAETHRGSSPAIEAIEA
jgi:hypothetical protein